MLDKNIVIKELKEIQSIFSKPPQDMIGNFFRNEKIKFKLSEFISAIIYSKKYDAKEEVKNGK